MPKRFLIPIFRLFRLQRDVESFGLFHRADKNNLTIALSKNLEGFASPELKLKTYEIVLRLRHDTRKKFGLLVVLGWHNKWNSLYTSLPDATQDVFHGHHIDISKKTLNQAVAAIRKTVDFDGAILIGRQGIVLDSGVYLENMRPKEVAKEMGHTRATDLSSAFGFMKKVHVRHLAAIAASYALKGTTVIVLSEEDNTARILEGGKIIWSTIKEEIDEVLRAMQKK